VLCAARATGAALARLHARPAAATARHDAGDEVAVARRWVEHAASYGLLDGAGGVDELIGRARRSLSAGPTAPCRIHRDLHDKQVLVDSVAAGPAVGLLDFDLAAVGEPALDLANLLVHFELHARQGHTSYGRSRACADAVLDGYRPRADIRNRLAGYDLAARTRLVAVYAFRPASASAALALVSDR
jgi:aminoglycoside phosphotransferase (APT) family kinase protein